MSPLVPRYRPLAVLLATLLAATLALILDTDAHAATAPCAAASIAAVHEPAASVARAVRCLVNHQRIAHGLRPLRASRPLRIAAERHGADMVAHHFFDHVSPVAGVLTDRVRRTGYPAGSSDVALGEDIAWGEGSLSSPEAIVDSWMSSPGHRAVILTPGYREMGVGVARGVPIDSDLGGATFVLDVGRR